MNGPPSATPPSSHSSDTPAPWRGIGWNFVSALLPILGSFLVSIFLAPYLGPTLWGRYSLVMTATTLWLLLAKFGIHAAVSRLVAEHPGEEGPWIRAALGLRLLTTASVALLALATAIPLGRSFGSNARASDFLWIAPILVAASLYELAGEIFVGLSRFRQLFAMRAAFLLLRMGAVALVVVGGLGVGEFLGGHATAQLLPAMVAIVTLWRWSASHGWGSARHWRRTWQLSVPLAFGSASFLVFSHTDRLMLGWMRDETTVGQFSVARNILDASMFAVIALGWSLRPALVRAAADPRRFQRELGRGLALATGFAVIAPLMVGFLGAPLVVFVYGDAYAPAARLLQWMTPILFLRGIGAVLFPALLALDEQHFYARLMVWTAVVNVGANLVAIRPWGADGAILATVLSLLVLTVGGFWRIARHRGFSLTPR